MTKEEMAKGVEKICQTYDAIFNNKEVFWEWGWYYVEFCAACGIEVDKPEGDGEKDKKTNCARSSLNGCARSFVEMITRQSW